MLIKIIRMVFVRCIMLRFRCSLHASFVYLFSIVYKNLAVFILKKKLEVIISVKKQFFRWAIFYINLKTNSASIRNTLTYVLWVEIIYRIYMQVTMSWKSLISQIFGSLYIDDTRIYDTCVSFILDSNHSSSFKFLFIFIFT